MCFSFIPVLRVFLGLLYCNFGKYIILNVIIIIMIIKINYAKKRESSSISSPHPPQKALVLTMPVFVNSVWLSVSSDMCYSRFTKVFLWGGEWTKINDRIDHWKMEETWRPIRDNGSEGCWFICVGSIKYITGQKGLKRKCRIISPEALCTQINDSETGMTAPKVYRQSLGIKTVFWGRNDRHHSGMTVHGNSRCLLGLEWQPTEWRDNL